VAQTPQLTSSPSVPVASATPAPTVPARPTGLLFPEPLKTAKGDLVQGPITPYDGFTDAGEFKLGLMGTLAPNHVKAVVLFLGEAFNDTPITLVPGQGLLLQGKAQPGPVGPLPVEGTAMAPTRGSLYFDGKQGLLIVLDAKELPANWHFVGQAIVSEALLQAATEKKAPRISKIEGISI
jgi:hypothetical protein